MTALKNVKRSRGKASNLARSNPKYKRIIRAFDKVKGIVSKRFPSLKKTRLFIGCPHAMEKHSHHQLKNRDKSGKAWRWFMHTGHMDNLVCVHPDAEREMPDNNKVGMFFHEFGHLINDIQKIPNTQKNADRVIRKYFGIKIRYTDPGRIQYVDLSEKTS